MKNWKSVLVIYDVEDTKIRNKIVKILESYGIRVQKSAFECYVDNGRLTGLTNRIHRVLGEEDSVRIYTPLRKVYDFTEGEDVDMYSQSVVIV